MGVPYNQVRRSPDGAAIAWHRPEVEGDDAQPWLVIEEDPMCGVDHTWHPDEHVANWTVLDTALDQMAGEQRVTASVTNRPADDQESPDLDAKTAVLGVQTVSCPTRAVDHTPNHDLTGA